ncbi:MAG: hypothetical protein PWQ22_1147 [Archaeoglobaceae archaeon]|nr:hypothetical protein [Archaeoglobaceae archaeon]MDK2876737.1 hypothetical protein [Archaeoglobaceae archaeon]
MHQVGKTFLFPIIWILVALVWLMSFPLHDTSRWDLNDIAIESCILIVIISAFYITRKIPALSFGLGVLVIGWLINVLDEFTSEPDFISTTLEGLIIIAGFSLLFFGFFKLINAFGDELRTLSLKYGESKEEMEWFKMLVENSPIPQVVYDENRKFAYVNTAFEELTGYKKHELLNGVFWEIVEDSEKDKVREVIKRRMAQQKVEPYLLKIKRKDGTNRIVQVHGVLGVFKGKKYALISFVDITEIENERRRNLELSKMLSIINRSLRHDVMNALASAFMYMDLYKETRDESLCEKVRNSIERAVNIVRDLKDFELAIEKGEMKVLSVKSVAEEVAKGFNLRIIVEGDCNVFADKGLKIVFENLFQNAIQHGKTDRIEVKIRRLEDNCEIRVADFGKGVPDEIKGKIFEEGFSYGEGTGTGLGLFITKKIVERYGGRIWVEDNKPKGAVFVVVLKAL